MSIGFYSFTVHGENDGQTLKTFLRREIGLSARSMTVLKYASDTGVFRSGAELKAHDTVHEGDIIEIRLPREECGIEAVKGALDILFEDDRILAVNKPPYMPVHPTKDHQLDTLANIVSFYQRERGESYTFRALNRLDRNTSGCVIIAKDRIAYSLIMPTVKKLYTAVCEGIITQGGTISSPIALEIGSKIKRSVCEDGQRAVTHYEPMAIGNDHTLCKLRLETGRTHQIRCHMSSIGHPLAGDDLYGGSLDYIDRQALHCKSASFVHPDSGQLISFDTDIPDEFYDIIKE